MKERKKERKKIKKIIHNDLYEAGGSFEGQYIHLNVRKHFPQALSLSLEFMNDANTHDAAHHLELAFHIAKNGKSDRLGKHVVAKCD